MENIYIIIIAVLVMIIIAAYGMFRYGKYLIKKVSAGIPEAKTVERDGVKYKEFRRTSYARNRFKYTFLNGLIAYQEEIIWEKIKNILLLIKDTDIKDFKSADVNALLDALTKYNLLEKFFNIILVPEKLYTDDVLHNFYQKLTATEVWTVLSDFFTLNPGVIEILADLPSAAAGSQASQASVKITTALKSTEKPSEDTGK